MNVIRWSRHFYPELAHARNSPCRDWDYSKPHGWPSLLSPLQQQLRSKYRIVEGHDAEG
jgi:hypothetical protein